MTLQTHGIRLGYGAHDVVTDLDLRIPDGELTVLVGPNGCGKSTILRGLSGLLPARHGQVAVQGESLSSLAPKDLARRLAILPQGPIVPEGLTVKELVSRGRYPHQGFFTPWTEQDEAAVVGALSDVGLLTLGGAAVESLSGGQRQRAWIAMVLAQDTQNVLLDEPTTYLDLAHAVEVMEVLSQAAHRGRAVAVVLHDLTLAARYADTIVVIRDGAVEALGPPSEVITEARLADVFGLDAAVVEIEGAPAIVPRTPVRTASLS